MSSSLVWEPVVKQKTNDLPDELKFVLRKMSDPVDLRFSFNNISYLEGLHHAGVKGAKDLIKAIEKHGEIEIKETW